MVCLACSRLTEERLCLTCELSLRPAPEQYLEGVGPVCSAFHHRDAARLLVHHLKYRGVVAAGRRLAEAMADHVPGDAVLVPVRRVGWRRLRYGVDPALELALRLAALTGCRVVDGLAAPFWGKPRAGRAHGLAPRFRLRHPVADRPVTLVDDVITTGATLAAAASTLPSVAGAITATTSKAVGRPRASTPELASVADGGAPTE